MLCSRFSLNIIGSWIGSGTAAEHRPETAVRKTHFLALIREHVPEALQLTIATETKYCIWDRDWIRLRVWVQRHRSAVAIHPVDGHDALREIASGNWNPKPQTRNIRPPDKKKQVSVTFELHIHSWKEVRWLQSFMCSGLCEVTLWGSCLIWDRR